MSDWPALMIRSFWVFHVQNCHSFGHSLTNSTLPTGIIGVINVKIKLQQILHHANDFVISREYRISSRMQRQTTRKLCTTLQQKIEGPRTGSGVCRVQASAPKGVRGNAMVEEAQWAPKKEFYTPDNGTMRPKYDFWSWSDTSKPLRIITIDDPL